MSRAKISPRWIIYIFSGLLFTLSLFMIFGERGVLHLWRLSEEKKSLDEKNFRLQTENELLRERVYRLRHDDLYLEKIAREDLGLVRPGEIVYRFAPLESKNNRSKGISGSLAESPRSSGQRSRP